MPVQTLKTPKIKKGWFGDTEGHSKAVKKGWAKKRQSPKAGLVVTIKQLDITKAIKLTRFLHEAGIDYSTN